ncbi:hypothetical protein [Conyzicola sp.]|uniref:antitoxin VbhA family protein n=1 Tax=Conyzicola sp. TaxID=1969404 RepID=UPI003988CEA6
MAEQHIPEGAALDERARMVGLGLHAWQSEGAEVDDETKADLIEYAAGNLSSEEIIRRGRVRYGLE